jgi:hypothetical protein
MASRLAVARSLKEPTARPWLGWHAQAMTWWNNLILRITQGGRDAGPIRLNAATEATLGNALRQLTPGGRGWIGQKDARRLFSNMEEDDVMALTDWDQLGVIKLGRFAASHGCDAVRERDRVVFTRKAN